MDVRCERCNTEYEFDDARITEAGVTVKCTTCSHVFKVKKKALIVAVPVIGEDATTEIGAAPTLPPPPSGTPASGTAAAGSDKTREWKVRQSNGNVFNFKELTTLQKWIVERKVSRDDEISLTGESWKRLGNIAELASFFQVVEEAQKAQQLSALQSGGYLAYNPGGGSGPYPAMPTVPSSPPAPAAVPPGMAQPPAPVAQQPTSINVPIDVTGVVAAPPAPPPPSKNPTASFGNPLPPPSAPPLTATVAPSRRAGPVKSAQRRAPVDDDDDDDFAAAGMKKQGGGAGKWLGILLVLALLGAGGYFGYFNYYLPMEQQKAEDQKKAAEEQARLAREEKDKADAVALAAAQEQERLAALAAQDAGVPDAGTAEVDAGTPYVDAGVAAPVVKKEPVRNFDWYITQGDKLRDREKPEAALDMYGKAEELKPDRAEPLAGKGLALLDMGQKPAAEAAFQAALKINGRYGVAIMGLAETYRAMGNKASALKWYERYLDALPNGPEAPVATEAIRRLKSE